MNLRPFPWITLVLGLTVCGGPVSAEESSPQEDQLIEDKILFDFTRPDQAEVWRITNDDLMGGVSQSELTTNEDSTVTFSGILSLENNGGFASVRTLPWDYGLDDSHQGVHIRVRGDGRTYRFRLRLDREYDDVAYQAGFETAAGEWIEVELMFSDFEAGFRGKSLPDAGPVVPSGIRQVGFMISDKQEGPFALDVDWISVVGRTATE